MMGNSYLPNCIFEVPGGKGISFGLPKDLQDGPPLHSRVLGSLKFKQPLPPTKNAAIPNSADKGYPVYFNLLSGD